MAIPIEIQRDLNTLANIYARQFLAKARTILNQKKYKASGATANSLKVRVTPSNGNQSPVILLEYDEAGDFIAKKRLIYTKQAPADEILDTIKSGKFRIRSVPGYAAGVTPNIPIESQQKRVAFAIARSKYKDQKHRRKRWKRDALSDLLRQMNRQLATTWANKTAQVIAKSLTT